MNCRVCGKKCFSKTGYCEQHRKERNAMFSELQKTLFYKNRALSAIVVSRYSFVGLKQTLDAARKWDRVYKQHEGKNGK